MMRVWMWREHIVLLLLLPERFKSFYCMQSEIECLIPLSLIFQPPRQNRNDAYAPD
jgi:hypothetical protein